jgi:hypothetical protein
MHCWKVMYSVTVPGAAAPWHVTRHDWSFCKQVVATQTATDRQAGSFGQLVGPTQQWSWTQVAQEDAVASKIWVAPGQLPASTAPTIWPGGVPASLTGEDPPPPGDPPLHDPPLVGVQPLASGGLGVDEEEQANKRAAIAPASAAELAEFKDELFEAMAIAFSGLEARRLSRVLRGAEGRLVLMGEGQVGSSRAAHTSRAIETIAACLPLRGPGSIGSN